MKKYVLDMKGQQCPLPVVKTKKILEEYDQVTTIVDNLIATQNLEKLSRQLNYNIKIDEVSKKEYNVTISKNNNDNAYKIIDTEKDKCVIPVQQAKRALEKFNKVSILVANDSVEEILNFANKNKYSYNIDNLGDKSQVTIEREDIIERDDYDKDKSYIVVINKKIMGHGSDELGSRLIKGFLYALTEQDILPQKILFYNEGSHLVDKDRSHVLKELKILEENGVELLCCGACKDFYNIELAVGTTTNMYFIVEDMRNAKKIVRP